jgi:digeranylgeranylglycerophospholipid reductase
MQDVCSCAFGRAAHASVPIDRIELHYGSNVAPGGYGWVFPRGDGSANIGLGVLGARSRAGLASECLQVFARRRFPGATLTHVHCGGVPVAQWTRPLVRGGAMLVGDAARQVDALSGGGINFAMMAGKLAGTAAAAACAGASFQERELQAYERAWRKGPGRTLSRVYALKQMVIGLSDATLDDIARRLTGRKMGGMSLVSVCFGAFARRPLLLLKALMVYR